jgi:hypothetical protein
MPKNTLYIVKTDEGKYLVICAKERSLSYKNSDDRDDDPMYYYQLENIPLQFALNFHRTIYRTEIKVFDSYRKAIEFLSLHKDMI